MEMELKTNTDPHIKNKNIDNKKLFIMIKKNYEKLLFKSFVNLLERNFFKKLPL